MRLAWAKNVTMLSLVKKTSAFAMFRVMIFHIRHSNHLFLIFSIKHFRHLFKTLHMQTVAENIFQCLPLFQQGCTCLQGIRVQRVFRTMCSRWSPAMRGILGEAWQNLLNFHPIWNNFRAFRANTLMQKKVFI